MIFDCDENRSNGVEREEAKDWNMGTLNTIHRAIQVELSVGSKVLTALECLQVIHFPRSIFISIITCS